MTHTRDPEDMPPLPPLTWDEFFWIGEDILSTWVDKQCDGEVEISVKSPRRGACEVPAVEQVAAYAYLKEHEGEITQRLLESIFQFYNGGERAAFLAAVDDYDAELAPPIGSPEEMRSLITISTVHVMAVSKDGHSYLGFEFGCTWEHEHGLGVMTHKDRVLRVGHADTAFDYWIGTDDGGADLLPSKPRS